MNYSTSTYVENYYVEYYGVYVVFIYTDKFVTKFWFTFRII